MKNLLAALTLTLSLTATAQSYIDIGTINDTTVMLYKVDGKIQAKYMKTGSVVKTTLSDNVSDSFISMNQKRAEIQKNPKVPKSTRSYYTPSNDKDALIRRYKNMGWKQTGYSNYREHSSVTLERGDISKGNYCVMILSFSGNKLEGESKSCY